MQVIAKKNENYLKKLDDVSLLWNNNCKGTCGPPR